jgi:Ca-activated chloride channel family protein
MMLTHVIQIMLLWRFAALLLFAQGDEPITFRTSVSLVRVDARVSTASGVGITGLHADDFVVYDENAKVQTVDFAAESEPLNVLLLLDVSNSMSRYLGEMSAKAQEALRTLRSGDKVAVMLFAQRSELVQPFSTDNRAVADRVVNSVFKQTLGRDTFINEGLLAGARALAGQKGRRALLIVTDNDGARNAVSDKEVATALQASDIVVNALIAGTKEQANTSSYTNPESGAPDVERYARGTGGSVLKNQPAGDAFASILREMVTRYVLQYPAPGGEPGSNRRIRVELTPQVQRLHPAAKIQAREQYQVTQ